MTAKWIIRIVFAIVACVVIISACRKTDSNPGPKYIEFKVPSGFPAPNYNFATNPLTQQAFDLGKKLFYDGRLSKDGNFPCASCHQQLAGFANFDHDLSHGFDNQFTTRNAPPLFNLVWHKEMHWDGGINHIEVQPLAPITAPNEMAEEINTVIAKLQADSSYPQLFRAAFGNSTISSQQILLALTQFVGSMVSANSKYDKVNRGEAEFTEIEKTGYALFKEKKCNSCHAEPLFTDMSFRNTGIPVKPALMDLGRMRITNKSEDSLKFKVPSLRNVRVSFPYGHDGRFPAIKSMLDHYSSGVQDGPSVDPLVKNKIALTELDKFYLTQFLYTLTDSSFLQDKRFAQPE
ncbi:MAG: cytochrome-c peroxidase [Chitinophagaceae bacterium]|nr:cytochrome-c peroxidase [Chitinophagaceae bacterium]